MGQLKVDEHEAKCSVEPCIYEPPAPRAEKNITINTISVITMRNFKDNHHKQDFSQPYEMLSMYTMHRRLNGFQYSQQIISHSLHTDTATIVAASISSPTSALAIDISISAVSL